MRTFISIGILASLATAILAEDASEDPTRRYYNELDCKPVSTDGKITKYDCSVVDNLTTDKCYFKGQYYPIHSVIESNVTGDPCIASCICEAGYPDRKSLWTCVNIECPEHFNPRLQEGHVRLYEHGSCCSESTYDTKSSPLLPTCTYESKTYLKGQQFYPDNECVTCICDEGFNGNLTAPWCRPLACNIYLHYYDRIRDGCVPTYYKKKDCCPIPVFRCPEDEDQVTVVGEASAKAAAGDTCKFGKLTVKVGEQLSKSEEHPCVECSCLVPPHVSCVMNAACYEQGINRKLKKD